MNTVLVINPGSTSTKIAVFKDEEAVYEEAIVHSQEDLSSFKTTGDQRKYREKLIIEALKKKGYSLEDFDTVACRGGLIGPVKSGTYVVDEEMVMALENSKVDHASNLAGLIGYSFAKRIGVKAYITDPVSVDEMADVARVSGIPEIERKSFSHALNTRAVARKAALELGKRYEDLNLVVAHLGGGISVSAHDHGKMIDVNNANDEGPFSPERSGELPVGDVVKIAFSNKYTRNELKKRYVGRGGLVAYLGTNDLRDAMKMAEIDPKAALVIKAMAYQISQCIAEMSTALNGNVDAIILTGGMAHSSRFVEMIKANISKLSLIVVISGGYEMEALAMGALRILKEEEKAQKYVFER